MRVESATLRLPFQGTDGVPLVQLKHGDLVFADGQTWVVIGRVGAAAGSIVPYLVERSTLRFVDPREGAA